MSTLAPSRAPVVCMKSLRGLALGAALLLLTACSALVPRPPTHAATPAEAEQFELGGRINLRLANEAFPGRVQWRHDSAIDELSFFSPIGTSVARMGQDPDGAWLITADGEEHLAKDLRELAFDVLGWDLPLDALPYWVRGLAWPDASAEITRSADGRIQTLRQAGWEVSYLAWDGAGVRGLPSKLDVAGERLKMRLLIERWNLDPDVGQGAVAEKL